MPCMPTGEPPLRKMGDGGGEVPHLDEGMVGEILLRLPARSVLRCRAVCTAWRRLADSPKFLAAHALRRPIEVLLYTRPVHGCGEEDLGLDALAVVSGSGARRRRLASIPPMPHHYWPCCCLLSSCDGLLLLGHGHGDDRFHPFASFLVCNPATRQWTELPRLAAAAPGRLEVRESGFYRHAPSGEYRLLCHVTPDGGAQAPPYYCVLSAGADEPRRLATAARATRGFFFEDIMTPAALGGRLHWLRHMEAGSPDSMVAFDTAAETFRQMTSPPVACKRNVRLLVADGSTLMAVEHGDVVFDLWALEGYTVTGGEAAEMRWERRHRVEVPWRAQRPTVVCGTGDGSGDVVLGSDYGVVVYNVRSGAARWVDIDDDVRESDDKWLQLSPIGVLRESLVRHGFFDARPHPGVPLFHFF